MGRKLYFITVFYLGFFLLNSFAWGWQSYKARIGGNNAYPYQSSNPTVELKTTRNINQQQSVECYLFAFVGALESANSNGWKRYPSPEISAEYLLIQKFLAWSKEALTNESTLSDTFYFLDGGDVHHALKLSVENGLLPQQLFKPRVAFSEWDITKLYADIKEITKEGRKVVRSVRSEDTRSELVEYFIKKIEKRISQEAGVRQQQFVFDNKGWDTHSFEDSYGIKRNSHIFMMYPQGKWDMENPLDLRKAIIGMVEAFKGAFNYRQSSWNQIWQYLVGSIDGGLPVILSVKWAGSYHVLNVVGYEYNNANEIVSFKLKNSWGEDYGDQGHAYFGLEDLQKNTTAIWGFDKP